MGYRYTRALIHTRSFILGAVAGALALTIAAVVVMSGALASASAHHTSARAATTTGNQAPTTSPADQAQINANVNRLLGRMTVAEKFGQLEMAGPAGANGTPGASLLQAAREGQVGSVLDMVGVANINQLQHAALQSRLHIPIIASLDVIHGYRTIFPVPLAESTSWDPALVANDESVSASEATADGIK